MLMCVHEVYIKKCVCEKSVCERAIIMYRPVLEETSRMRARASLQVWYMWIISSLRRAASWLSSII